MDRTLKRLFSFFLAFVIVCSMIPVASATDGNEEGSVVSSGYQAPTGTYDADMWIEIATASELLEAFLNGDGVNAQGNADLVIGVKLTEDIIITQQLDGGNTSGTMLYVGYYANNGTDVRPQSVVLDLNGHTLMTDETVTRSRLFGLYGGSSLTITNGIVDMRGTYDGSSAAVFFHGNSALTVDGVNFTQTDFTARPTYGGFFAMSSASQTLRILNSDITYNGGQTGSVYRGGIIDNNGNATVTLVNSNFNGGSVVGGKIDSTTYRADGGQIWMSASAKLTAENCSFSGGKAARNGGLIFKNAGTNGSLSFASCSFVNGEAVSGGQLFLGTTGAAAFRECSFVNGSASANGGMIYKDAGSGKLEITDSEFTGGAANRGGQVYAAGTNASNVISGCSFIGAVAQDRGGALYISGKLIMVDCSIADNSSESLGGGIFVTGATTAVTLTGCTLNNRSGSVGGSVAKYGKGTLVLNDVDITGTATKYGGSIMVGNGVVIFNSGSIHNGVASNGGNILVSRDGTVTEHTLSYGIFIMNGGSIVEGNAKYGGNIRVTNGRAVINDGIISGGTLQSGGTGPDIQVYSGAAAETMSYIGEVGSETTTTVDVYDCLYIFGGKIGSIIADKKAVNFINGSADADGAFSNLNGYLGKHSQVAGEKDSDGYLAITHKNTDVGNDTEATCTSTGTINVVCSECAFTSQYDGSSFGGSYTYVDPVSEHEEEIVPGYNATCTSTGLTDGKKCTVCGEITVTQQEIPVAEHSWDDGVITDPTFENDGFTTYSCSVCGESKVVIEEGSQLKAVATADGFLFDSLHNAMNAGGQIVLLEDVILTEKLTVSTEATLNLNGMTLTLADVADNYGMVVKGNLTVMGEGTVVATGIYGIGVTGKLTVEAGNFNAADKNDYLIGNWGTTVVNGGCFKGVYNCVNNFNGTTVINGGTFQTEETDFSGEYEASDLFADAGLTVYGGIFSKELDAAICAEGYGVTDNKDGTYGVHKHNYEGVYTAATHKADAFTTYTCTICPDSYVEIHTNTMLMPPKATVSELTGLTLEDGMYRVWNGVVSDKESESLVTGQGELPLEVAVNFKAEETLEECLSGGFAKWLVDFNITIDGLRDGSFVADSCYLAGNYGSYGWIKIPLDGQTIVEDIAYPVVALYDPTLNYKDICKSVKDFTAAIHIDPAILAANPDISVKLELVMTNPTDATDTLRIGDELVYYCEDLLPDGVAQNTTTGKVYASISEALDDASQDDVIIMLDDATEEEINLNKGKTLDLNGNILTAMVVATTRGAEIIDRTEGEGKLVISRDYLVINKDNAQLPIWDENGYRFTTVGLISKTSNKVQDSDMSKFGFWFDNSDVDSLLAQALTNGGADNGLKIMVKLSWEDDSGIVTNRIFAFAEEYVIEYASRWADGAFFLNVIGVDSVSKLTLQAIVESTLPGAESVIVTGNVVTVK